MHSHAPKMCCKSTTGCPYAIAPRFVSSQLLVEDWNIHTVRARAGNSCSMVLRVFGAHQRIGNTVRIRVRVLGLACAAPLPAPHSTF